MNYVTDGIVLLSDDDYEFETANGEIIPWNHNAEVMLDAHFFEQAGITKSGYTIVKFNMGIMIKHDEPSRLLCVMSDYEPLDSAIRVMPAQLPILDIWSPILVNTVFKDGHHSVKKGDPIARIFVSYAANIEFVDDGRINPSLILPWRKLANDTNVLSTFNKELKKCPYHKPTDA